MQCKTDTLLWIGALNVENTFVIDNITDFVPSENGNQAEKREEKN